MFIVTKITVSVAAAIASLVGIVAVALGSSAPSLAANQALMLNGIGTAALPDLVMSNVLGGMFGSYERTNVAWPMQARPVTGTNSLTLTESVSQGVTSIDSAIAVALTKIGPNEHVTVVGLSAGSLVADEEIRRLLSNPNAPDKSKLTFVVVADSSRVPFNNNRFDSTISYQYQTPAQTKYDTLVVAAEYDGFADFPDRPWNVLAVANAVAGEIVTHVPSMFTDLSTVPAANVAVTRNALGGVTTRYFIPAAHLPLVQLMPYLASQEASLRKIVDSGYVRNDSKTAGAMSAAAANSAPAPAPATLTASPVTAPAPVATAPAPVVVSPAIRAAAAAEPAAPADSVRDLDGPAQTAPVVRAPASDPTAEAAHTSSHRGPSAPHSNRSDDVRSGAAKPAAAARAGSRPSV